MGSRRVLGFALSEHHDAHPAYGALAMAVAVRGGQLPRQTRPEVLAALDRLVMRLRSRCGVAGSDHKAGKSALGAR